MNKTLLEDLRFIIGLFFSIISVLLLAASFFTTEPIQLGFNLNLAASLFIGSFSIFMMALGFKFKNDQN